MLKEILTLWRDDDPMKDVLQRLGQMVTDAEYVFTHGIMVCRGHALPDATRPSVQERDRAVNKGERAVRRMLVAHLDANPGKDVSGCLAIMIMAKDLERLGDHGRNIFELAAKAEAPLFEYRIFPRLDALAGRLTPVLMDLRQAIIQQSSRWSICS